MWAKPGKTTTECHNAAKSWANVVPGEPTKDMTAVPPPAVPPGSVESQVPRRVPMDIGSVGVSLTQVQDLNQVATLLSPASGSQQMDTSRVADLSLTKNTTHRVGRHCLTASGAHVINANGHDNS